MTDERTLPERMFSSGFSDLIPIIPPGASLTPTSKIQAESIGKLPGVRLANGLWCGTNWRAITATADDVRTWLRWSASVGLRTDYFPCVDIDVADESLAASIERIALVTLGAAPIRVGNFPKRILAYRLKPDVAPFGRLRLWLRKGEKKYLVEVLAEGQQYVVHGIHPKTQRPYTWGREPRADELTYIELTDAQLFLQEVAAYGDMIGYDVEHEGDGRGMATRPKDQDGLLAPSIEELRTVVDLLPNDNEVAAGRDDWLRVGAAIKAAAGEAEEREAADLFVAWSMKWDGNDRVEGNDPDDARENFRRLKAPYAVGWPLLAEMAREYGYDDSTFEADEPETTPTSTEAEAATGPMFLSDQWLAAKVVKAASGRLRFVPAKEQWLCWDNGRWVPDAEMLAEDIIKHALRKISSWVAKNGASAAELKNADKEAREICSSGKLSAVMRLVKSDRGIAVGVESLDHDPWILNTPGGTVDLKTGQIHPPDPDQLCTRSTSVAPESGPAPVWARFLNEATRGDPELVGYLKRLAGYCLTGVTYEHKYAFLYGGGGNGKGTFVDAIGGVLKDYRTESSMDTFIASHGDRHPTELAALVGARMVTASETEAGKRWDEAKLKRMTGGDLISARGMRENFFTYRPQFKLVFLGNHRPEIRNLDKAMKRRTHLVPFTNTPQEDDQHLREKLEAEYPQILAWAIEGCLEWQQRGLDAPASVRVATEEYFEESDPIGQWIAECTKPDPAAWTPVLDLFGSWREYANQHEHYVGHSNRFSSLLKTRGFEKRPNPQTRRMEFGGLTLKPVNEQELPVG